MSAPDRTNGHSSPHGGAPRSGFDGPIAPPQNLEAEQSVLGAVLLSDTALPALIIDEHLQPDDFYREGHGRIYQAMLDLHALGEPVDALTLVEHLKQAGTSRRSEGARRSTCSPARCPPSATSASTRGSCATTRCSARLLRASYDIQARVHSHEARAARPRRPGRARDPRGRARGPPQGLPPIHDLLRAELDKLERLSREGKAITGTASGFDDLDTITGGFQPGNLIILAARPSMGKSALMANFAENAALESNKAVALFSLEMSESELAQRFIASQASIRATTCARARCRRRAGRRSSRRPTGSPTSPLYIDDSSDLSVLDVRAKARRLAQQNAGRPRPDPHRLPAAHARERRASRTASSRSARSPAASRRSRASSTSR